MIRTIRNIPVATNVNHKITKKKKKLIQHFNSFLVPPVSYSLSSPPLISITCYSRELEISEIRKLF